MEQNLAQAEQAAGREGTASRALVLAAPALQLAGRGAALSHELAAVVRGVELIDEPVRRLTVARNRSRVAVPGWRFTGRTSQWTTSR